MDGSQVLGVGLAALTHALKSRRTILLEELRQVERDLEAVDHTLVAAGRLGFSGIGSSPEPAPTMPTGSTPKPDIIFRTGARPTGRQNADLRAPCPFPSAKRDHEIHEAALASLGPYRDDKAIPPKRDRAAKDPRMPTDPVELAAVRESVRGIAEEAAKLPPGPGGRRHLSEYGLTLGEPMAPILRRILDASDRPLSTPEITQAFLRVRKVDIRGKQVTALTSRISSLLGGDAGKGYVRRIRQEGTRLILWQKPDQSSA